MNNRSKAHHSGERYAHTIHAIITAAWEGHMGAVRLLNTSLHEAERRICAGLRDKQLVYQDPETGEEIPQTFGQMIDTPRQETLLLVMTTYHALITSAQYGEVRNVDVLITADMILDLTAYLAHHPGYLPTPVWPHRKEVIAAAYPSLRRTAAPPRV